MDLYEAKQILKNNGFICEETNIDLKNLQEGDELLIFTFGDYGDYPRYKATILGLDDDVKPRMKGKTWKVELAQIKAKPATYSIGKRTAFTHGTYGDAVVYPVIRFHHDYEATDKTQIDSIFLLGEEVRFKSNGYKSGSLGRYMATDIENLNNGKMSWGSSNDELTSEKDIARVLAEHPELKKEYEEMETKYYNLRNN